MQPSAICPAAVVTLDSHGASGFSMQWLIGFVLFVLAIGTPRLMGCGNDCYSDSDCDDGNDCTREYCKWYDGGPYDGFSFCGPEFYACAYRRVKNGSPCEIDGQSGVCDAGECRLEDETSEPESDESV